jgi:hypothetical protein
MNVKFLRNWDAPSDGPLSHRYMKGGVYDLPAALAARAIKDGAAGDVVPVVDGMTDPAPAKGKPKADAKAADKTGDKTGAPTP